MGCFDGVIENNWVRSANSHPPWPGTVRSNWTLALIISMGCYLSVIDNHWFWSANSPPLPHSSSWSLWFLCSLWSTRQLSLTVQDMGCYLNVTENHSLGSANSPPPSDPACSLTSAGCFTILWTILKYREVSCIGEEGEKIISPGWPFLSSIFIYILTTAG